MCFQLPRKDSFLTKRKENYRRLWWKICAKNYFVNISLTQNALKFSVPKLEEFSFVKAFCNFVRMFHMFCEEDIKNKLSSDNKEDRKVSASLKERKLKEWICLIHKAIMCTPIYSLIWSVCAFESHILMYAYNVHCLVSEELISHIFYYSLLLPLWIRKDTLAALYLIFHHNRSFSAEHTRRCKCIKWVIEKEKSYLI